MKNPLLLPLAAVSVLALAEAVVIGVLWGRGGRPEPVVAPPSRSDADAPTPQGGGRPPPQDASAGVVPGKVGERVESAGLAVTVLKVSNDPASPAFGPSEGQKIVDAEVVLENNSGRNVAYYRTLFKLKDADGHEYGIDGLVTHQPALDWGTVAQGEKVRGHVGFRVGKQARGLTLVYNTDAVPNYKPVHIALGQ